MIFVISLVGVSYASCVTGQQSCSGSYGVQEVFFGGGGTLDTTCSSSYCAKQSLGETAIGTSSSSSYLAHAGFNTKREPYIQINVSSTSVNLGLLSTSSTATGTATFSVKAYLTSGYNVVTDSAAPAYGSHTLASLATPSSAAVGVEQFGINLVNNTTACGAPTNFGANPVQVPSTNFSFGTTATNYSTCGKFIYNNGDIIASSTQSSGETDYTISYIANISNVTPAGQYIMNQTLVATGTF